jgi:hypothetical protein
MRCSSVSAARSEKVNKQPAKMIFISSPSIIDSPRLRRTLHSRDRQKL